MRGLDTGLSLPRFRERLAVAARPLLLLDYDGTLAPFRVERDEATPYPGVRETLRRIRRRGRSRVVVISGRATADVRRLLGVPVSEIWGAHGHETRRDGAVAWSREAVAGQPRLAAAHAELTAAGWGDCLELKPGALAVHWRGLDATRARRLRSFLRQQGVRLATAARAGLRPFDGGLELRLPGRDKGWVVRRMLASAAGYDPIAFLGDDLTDEDGFRALRRRGLAVLVRPRRRATAARLWLRPPDELLEFLAWWI